MKKRLLFLVTAAAVACGVAVEKPIQTPNADALVGTWSVDLRPTPEADPYFQPFVVRSVDGNSFEGNFYGSEIANARLNGDWGALHFAFTTEDDSGVYHTSGFIDGDGLRGTTHSLGRDFLAVWSAKREE